MREFLRQLLGGGFRRFANEIMSNGPAGRTMEGALRRLAPARQVQTVVDVGASNGRWSIMASRHFPGARYLLVEAQAAAHETALRKLHARRPQMEFVLAAAGAREGTVHFDASDPLGGMASEQQLPGPSIEVPVTTIDAEVARRRMPGPFLIKLDTHGFEVPILEGAAQTLQQTAILVIEAYNFDLSPTSLRFPQMSLWVEKRGFRCVDLADVLYRPRDGALWQMDLFFVRDPGLEGRQAYR